ncbi:MAG: UDP-3-O-(3-hydroxymyristoyl)glucosamine N-acyltransferase [Muribaculaceae bacterium]|nr:UDP-3-O-(3-hydroxymyristoyl)glucosamine N-acyltransferase [Muribaculaceae bacterium]
MEFSANQIAALVNGAVEGDGNVTVNTFAKIEEGHKGAISFLANPKYTHFIYDTQSSIVLVSRSFVAEKPISATLIRVDDPYATVAQLLDMVSKLTLQHPVGIEQPCSIAEGVELDSEAYVGAFSYIAKGAKLGKGVKIYPQCYIGAGVEIGDGSVLYPGVKVYYGCKIGRNCILHSGVVVGADGFGFAPKDGAYSKIPQLGNVIIADDVEIGANACVDRATMGSTRIHKGVKLDNLIQVAHNCEIGEHTVMASQAGVAGSTKIGAHCMVGGQVGFAGHIRIGDGVQIGAQSGVPHDVEAGQRIMGYPAVPASDFFRQSVNIKNLSELTKKVRSLEQQLKK